MKLNQSWKTALSKIKNSYLNLGEGQCNNQVDRYLAKIHPHSLIKESNPFYNKEDMIRQVSKKAASYRVTADGIEIDTAHRDYLTIDGYPEDSDGDSKSELSDSVSSCSCDGVKKRQ